MTYLEGWGLVTLVTNILIFATWGFPVISILILSYAIEYYTKFKTQWRISLVAVALTLIYPLAVSYSYIISGDIGDVVQTYSTLFLLAGVLLGAYVSMQLLKFQKIEIGRTRITVEVLAVASIIVPSAISFMASKQASTLAHLILYNLSITSLILIFLTIGKLTQKYIPRYQMLAYSSIRVGSAILLIDPIIKNYIYLWGVELSVKNGLRLVAKLSQTVSILMLLIPLILIIMEAQARGVQLIPSSEKKDKKPMKYKLNKGCAYLLREENHGQSMEIFVEYVTHQHHGLLLTRTEPSQIRQEYNLRTTPILWMTNAQTDEKSIKPSDLERLHYTIRDFVQGDGDSIILMHRLDYLITENDFKKTLKLIHALNDTIMTSKATLIISVDPSTVSQEQLVMLLQELKDLTDIEKVSLGEPYYSLLEYIYSENKRRKTPSFKNITEKFDITKTTARKRIYELENKQLIKIINEGRYKYLEITDSGKNIVGSPMKLTYSDEDER